MRSASKRCAPSTRASNLLETRATGARPRNHEDTKPITGNHTRLVPACLPGELNRVAVSPERSGTVVAVVIFTAMLSGLLYRYWPNEERDIRRHLINLAEALSIPTTDN